MRKITVAALVALIWGGSASAAPILGGFDSSVLARCDDCSSLPQNLGFTIDFNGQKFSSVYVNNNGNVTFGAANASYTPGPMTYYAGAPIIAPYYADVDTRFAIYDRKIDSNVQGTVSFGQGHYSGASGLLGVPAYSNANAFGVTWSNVAAYTNNGVTDQPKFNTFQLLLIENGLAPGAFEIVFNEVSIQWLAGIASGSQLGAVGFSDGKLGSGGLHFDVPFSGAADLLDGQPHALNKISDTGVPGQFAMMVKTGQQDAVSVPEPATLGLLSLGSLALIFGRRRRS